MIFSKIIVEPIAGTYINDFMPELYKLSDKYKCEVHAKFNDTEILVKPRI